jgi:hypothetical protein
MLSGFETPALNQDAYDQRRRALGEDHPNTGTAGVRRLPMPGYAVSRLRRRGTVASAVKYAPTRPTAC